MSKALSKKVSKHLDEEVSTAIVIEGLEKESKPYVKQLSAYTKVTTQEEFDKVGNLIKQLKNLNAIAEKKKKKITDPLSDALKETRKLFKPFEDKVNKLELTYKLMLSNFLIQQSKKIEKVDEAFESGKIKKIGTYTNQIASLQVSGKGAAKPRSKMVAKVTDEKLIPREYLQPNMAAITEALKAGKKIKGVEYVEEKIIAI